MSEDGEKKKGEQRERDMICPSAALSVHLSCRCVSAAAHSTEHSIAGNGLCEFLCLTLSKRNERVCQYVCCRVIHVEADQHTQCINTSAACVFAMRVCVPIYTALFSQILQVMPLVLRVKLSWAQAFNFSEACMPVNLTSEWPRWCQSSWATKRHSLFSSSSSQPAHNMSQWWIQW